MATWARTNTNQLQSADLDLAGALDLDNGTAPGDFDPAGVNSVRFQLSVTGAAFGDDRWTALRRASLSTPGAAPNPDTVLATVDDTDASGLANTFNAFDLTDSAPDNAVTIADWEQSDVVAAGTSGTTTYATYQQTKGKDGSTLTIGVGDLTVTIDYTPAVAGPNEGSATGGIAWVGSVTGTNVRSGSVSGSIGWVGSVDGTSVRLGSTSGSIAWVGSVTGEAPVSIQDGEVLGAIDWAGTVTGTTDRSGDASGSLTWDGTVTGATTHEGSVSGALGWAGSVLGSADHEGSASGSIAWDGVVTGEAPTVGQQDGSVNGSITWTGAVTGEATHEGSASGSVDWVGSVVGESPEADVAEGAAFGSVSWVGTVDGSTVTEGSVLGAIDWVGSVSGQFPTGRTRLEGRSVSGFGTEGSPSGVGLEGTKL